MCTVAPGCGASMMLAAADVDADVADRAVVEDQVARLQVRRARPCCPRSTASTTSAAARRRPPPGVHRQAGAVEGVRARSRPRRRGRRAGRRRFARRPPRGPRQVRCRRCHRRGSRRVRGGAAGARRRRARRAALRAGLEPAALLGLEGAQQRSGASASLVLDGPLLRRQLVAQLGRLARCWSTAALSWASRWRATTTLRSASLCRRLSGRSAAPARGTPRVVGEQQLHARVDAAGLVRGRGQLAHACWMSTDLGLGLR